MERILIVDDDYSVRELYKYIFLDLGYEVETAKDGKEGLEKVGASRPDCMLLDISMPEMTGPEFAKELTGDPDPELGKIPFIVMTGENCTDASIRHAFQGNRSCRAFLPKITSPDAVATMVREILGSPE